MCFFWRDEKKRKEKKLKNKIEGGNVRLREGGREREKGGRQGREGEREKGGGRGE